MHRLKWIDRKFQFDVPPGWLPNVVARLDGTAGRLFTLTNGLSEEILTTKPESKWSIKEHIGHLGDLEHLHEGRLEDFRQRRDLLRAADMANLATEQAKHNNRPLQDLLISFLARRNVFIEMLSSLDDETHAFWSMHPRLQIPMKPIDMATFTAEHDDHHIASIREILMHQYKG